MSKTVSRRQFIKTTGIASAGAALGTAAFSKKSYSRILGANDRVNFAIAGLHGRGNAHLSSIAALPNTAVTHICDVDQRYFDSFSPKTEKLTGQKPKAVIDYRELVKDKDIDVITIATPEHWHAPMAVMALQAGKHVYVEKPCSHNPAEGELLVAARDKYGKLVQMGNQQRSSDFTIKLIQRIHEGLVGRVYMGKAWYSNKRGSIGTGKEIPVPDFLNWDLWQGPAPRQAYRDNVHPYNWHWFWDWGTGETLNNATHEVDICRWALQETWPLRVSASGGRYHYDDDWEFYDTLVTSFEYENSLITWEGKSCQGMQYFDQGRGASIHGTEGTVIIGRGGYKVIDRDNQVIEDFKREGEKDATLNVVGAGPMTTEHFANLIDGIKNGAPLRSPIEEGNVSVTILQLSNIAWKLRDTLHLDPQNGHITHNAKAQAMRHREYEPGWEPETWHA
ncbi:MAG: Gfo/Idh/MocA family oxidoreductase [candidate division KSB1 bacterium]|nr:Gfo/Idh/MocA family oxidoreductase [candidate division KSB1 bacterium]